MTKTLNQIIIFFLHQNQNIFFSNIGNQNIFLEKKKHTPPPLQVKWSFPYSNDIISFLSTSLNIYNKTCKLGVEKIAGYKRGGDRWLYGMYEIYYTTSRRNVNIMFTYTRSLDYLLFSLPFLKRHQLYQKIKS